MGSPAGPRAIGRLASAGVWVGFEIDEQAWRVVYAAGGDPDGPAPRTVVATSRRDLLLDAAIAYFAEALGDPPPELEATHEDAGALLDWMLQTEPDAARARRLRLALDAVEDGLAADEVIARLMAARRGETAEPADVVDRLVCAYEALREGGR